LNISYQTTVVVLYENGTIKNLYLSNTLSTEVISSETSLKELFLTDSIVIIVTDENGIVKRIYMNSLNTIKITSSGWTSVVVVIAGITFDIPWLVIFLVIGIVFGLMFAILYCKRNKGDKQNVV
jgi:heme/copper-type cytochrome/quinol oxidase subunit 3